MVKKILIIILSVILALIVAAVISAWVFWHNEISTLASMKKLVDAKAENRSAPVWIMDVAGDYYFDEFLEGGGASDDDALIGFITDKVTKGIVPVEIVSPHIGCSSFAAVNPDGSRYFGRNYDFEKTSTAMIVRTNPGNGRYASISSVDLQFLGIKNGESPDTLTKKLVCLVAPYVPLDGINEAGVSCGIYMSFQGNHGDAFPTNQTTSAPDLTSTTMLRMILDYASSVDEAVELVKSYDLHDSADTSFHYMVADSSGRSAILEWVGDKDHTDTDGTKRELRVYYNTDDAILGEKEGRNDFQYISNFIVTPDYYVSESDMKGLDRYREIEHKINPDDTNTKGLLSEEGAMDVLKAVGRRKWEYEHQNYDSNVITLWSALYNLTDKTATWVSNEEFDNPDAVFTFDFSYIK